MVEVKDSGVYGVVGGRCCGMVGDCDIYVKSHYFFFSLSLSLSLSTCLVLVLAWQRFLLCPLSYDYFIPCICTHESRQVGQRGYNREE